MNHERNEIHERRHAEQKSLRTLFVTFVVANGSIGGDSRSEESGKKMDGKKTGRCAVEGRLKPGHQRKLVSSL